MKKLSFLIILFILAVSVSAQSTKVTNYLQDNANIFDSSQKQLIGQSLRDFEQKTSIQYVIFTTDSIPQDTSLEEYSLKIAEDNKIGQEGNDNGLLFFIAIKDRKFRWETGYGIEDVLNSAWLGRTSRDYMVPYFQQGDFAGGILAGSQIVMQKVLNTEDEDIFPSELAVRPIQQPQSSKFRLIFWGIFLLLMIVTSIGHKKRHGMLPAYIYMGAASGMFRGGRGGFGGFSGGGGGFGGGGFSGGW